MMNKKMMNGRLIALVLGVCALNATAEEVTGAGSSAAAPIYRSWGRAFEKATGVRLTYESAGSSAGLRKIRAGEVGYGASDVVPSEADLKKDGLVAFPIAVTGIAPVINLPKVAQGQLRLDGAVLARIFLGQIAQWNAPEIAALNPDLTLPPLPIKVVVRSDGSGTTYNFSDYLSKVSADWRAQMGVGASLKWPGNFLPAKGSEGVVKTVSETTGAIGYVDYGYVRDNKLNWAQMANLNGEYVQPSNDSFRTALNASDWAASGKFTTTLTHLPGRGVWPITMGTFALAPQVTDKPYQTVPALKFFVWSFMHGDELVQQHNFVRLPDKVQASAYKVIASIKDSSGQQIGMLMTGF